MGRFFAAKGVAEAFDVQNPKVVQRKDRRGQVVEILIPQRLWQLSDQPITTVHVKAGSRLYAHHGSAVIAIDASDKEAGPRVAWKKDIDGTPATMLAANGKLLASSIKPGLIQLWLTSEAKGENNPINAGITSMNHGGLQVNSLTFSLDGKLLASGGSDGTVKLWDLRDIWLGSRKPTSK